jgi:hypothetical protein
MPLSDSGCRPRYLHAELPMGVSTKVMNLILLYGCEIWSLTMREEHKLRVFENRVLRRIFVPKREEETRGKRRHFTIYY